MKKRTKNILLIIVTLIVCIAFYNLGGKKEEKSDKELTTHEKVEREIKKADKEAEAEDTDTPELTEKEKEEYREKLAEDSTNDDLKESIKNSIGDTVKLESVNYTDHNAVVVLKGKDKLSKSMIIKSMNQGIANTILGVKDSIVPIENLTVDVIYPLENSGNTRVIKSKWDKNIIDNMNKDMRTDITNNPQDYAVSYWQHGALK